MSKWILPTNNEDAEYQLFCFPYAGSGAIKYLKWSQFLDKRIEMCPVLLPGREYKLGEPLISDYKMMVESIFEGIKDRLVKKKYSLFGHSMGSILAYELAKLIEKEDLPQPDVLFLSGSPLTGKNSSIDWQEASDDDMAAYLVSIGGTPKEVANDVNLRKVYFPILRSDHKLVSGYHFAPKRLERGNLIHAFAAKDDEVVDVKYSENISVLSDNFKITYFSGGHFFVDTLGDKICELINEDLAHYLK